MVASQEGGKNPYQEGKQDTNELSKATQRYKILVEKKLTCKRPYGVPRKHLRLQLEDLQDVNLKQARAQIEAVQAKLTQTVEQHDAEEQGQEFDKFLQMAQKLGVELTPEQQTPKQCSVGKEEVPAPPTPICKTTNKDHKRPRPGDEVTSMSVDEDRPRSRTPPKK